MSSSSPSRAFLDTPIADVVAQLSVDEKILLLSAPNWWNTNEVKRLGIPAIRMSDGPNVRAPSFPLVACAKLVITQGVRGSSHFVPTPAQCLPVSLCTVT